MTRPYRAGGDRGKMEFSMTEEQYDRIFGDRIAALPAHVVEDRDLIETVVRDEDGVELPCDQCAIIGACEYGECVR